MTYTYFESIFDINYDVREKLHRDYVEYTVLNSLKHDINRTLSKNLYYHDIDIAKYTIAEYVKDQARS